MNIGDIYKVKEECREECPSFASHPQATYIKITGLGSGLSYDILDNKKKKVDHCFLCFSESDLIMTKDFSTLEVGDVVLEKYKGEHTILAVLPGLVGLSKANLPQEFDTFYTEYEFEKYNITIKDAEEVEELTVEEISERLGKTIKVVK